MSAYESQIIQFIKQINSTLLVIQNLLFNHLIYIVPLLVLIFITLIVSYCVKGL